MGKYALFFVTLQFIIETNQTDNQTGISYSTPDGNHSHGKNTPHRGESWHIHTGQKKEDTIRK